MSLLWKNCATIWGIFEVKLKFEGPTMLNLIKMPIEIAKKYNDLKKCNDQSITPQLSCAIVIIQVFAKHMFHTNCY